MSEGIEVTREGYARIKANTWIQVLGVALLSMILYTARQIQTDLESVKALTNRIPLNEERINHLKERVTALETRRAN